MNSSKTIIEITNESILLKSNPHFFNYKIRCASRGLLLKDDQMALINISKKNYHKLPGGGVEGNETIQEAFMREILEETGCNCEIVEGGEVTLEWRENFEIMQISYVFLAKVKGEPGEVKFEQAEIDEGSILTWVPINKAIEIITDENPIDYEDKFIHKRDKAILEFYKEKLV